MAGGPRGQGKNWGGQGILLEIHSCTPQTEGADTAASWADQHMMAVNVGAVLCRDRSWTR